MVRVGVVGASGYTGVELLRVLDAHADVRVTHLAAGRSAGAPLHEAWPGLTGIDERPMQALDAQALVRDCDVVFLALPHGVSASVAPELLAAGLTVIDLGADFRLKDPAAYAKAYGAHPHPELLALAVYGLPEKHRAALAGAKLIANPGCYPTATALAALPLVENGWAHHLVSSCLSGVSGAGRTPNPRNLYCDVSESAAPYSLAGAHRHVPEIEQELGQPVVFSPHLVPMNRGMVATVHSFPAAPVDASTLREAFRARYEGHPAVVLRDQAPSTADVRGTGRAHVFPTVDESRGNIVVVCVIDNLCKGASTQAVQNMNLALGLPEMAGIPLRPLLP